MSLILHHYYFLDQERIFLIIYTELLKKKILNILSLGSLNMTEISLSDSSLFRLTMCGVNYLQNNPLLNLS